MALRRHWRRGLAALMRLRTSSEIADVMEVIQSLEGPSIWAAFRRMERSAEGRRQIQARVELADRLADRGWLASFPPGTVGAEYLAYVERTQFTARGLRVALTSGPLGKAVRTHNPVAWFSRRISDLHDVIHVLTGYGTDRLGEGCIVAFEGRQLRSLGYLAIAAGAALVIRPGPVWRAWCAAKRAKWLFDLDVESLFAEPLGDARIRLGLA